LGNPVDNPHTRAEGAYDRALAAFQEKSYEVARRWALEALAYDRQHSGARALLGRLDAARKSASPFQSSGPGSEVVSTDPTVLISRASQPAAAESIDPTVMIRRDDPRRPAETDARPAPPPLTRSTPRPAADPTVIGPPKNRAPSRTASSFSVGAALQSLGSRLQGLGRSSAGRSQATAGSWFSTPGARGALIAVATVAVGVLLVWGLFLTVRWFFPAGQQLTIAKPTGGTIVGPGIECGTGGSRCSTRVASGEPVELEARPDKDYVYSGFTGDCAPTGRLLMTQARNCGAIFERVTAPSGPVTFTLTITKPEGGTVIAAGGILCGTLGSTCSAEIPSGQPVTLTARADDGYTWDHFTGDCPSTGDTTMTSAKTCSATFTKTTTTVANVGPRTTPTSPPPPRRQAAPPVVPVPAPPPQPTPTNPSGSQGSTPTTAGSSSTDPSKPVAPPISADDHAKQEIQALVKSYCAALQTLKVDAVKSLYNQNNEPDRLKEQLREYKSLKCVLAPDPPEWVTLDSSEAGGVAKLKFGMKRVIQMGSGGAPKDYETIVTMVVSRKNFQSRWLIDRATHEEKPK